MPEWVWRLRESPKDFRYGGFGAWLRWVFRGVAADYEP